MQKAILKYLPFLLTCFTQTTGEALCIKHKNYFFGVSVTGYEIRT